MPTTRFFVYFLLLLVHLGFPSAAPWSEVMVASGSYKFTSAVEDGYGNVIAWGNVLSSGDGIIMKIRKNGTLFWCRTIEVDGTSSDIQMFDVLVPENGFIYAFGFASGATFYQGRVFVINPDDGSEVVSKKFLDNVDTRRGANIRGAIDLGYDSFLAMGGVNIENSGTNYQAFLMNVSYTDFSIRWKKKIGVTIDNEHFQRIVPIPSGGWVVVGYRNSNDKDILIAKLDSNMDFVWMHAYDYTGDELGVGVDLLGDDILACSTTNVMLVDMSNDGDVTWSKEFNLAGSIGDCVFTDDGNILVAAGLGSPEKPVLIKINVGGDTILEARRLNPSDEGALLRITKLSQSYLIAGYIKDTSGSLIMDPSPNKDGILLEVQRDDPVNMCGSKDITSSISLQAHVVTKALRVYSMSALGSEFLFETIGTTFTDVDSLISPEKFCWSCHDYYLQANSSYFEDFGACSFKGDCLPDGSCVCLDDKHDPSKFTPSCEYECFGVLFNHTNETCSGNGVCEFPDGCLCDEHYFGSYCNVTTCFGDWNNMTVTTSICGGHGQCEYFDVCFCDDNYFGEEVCNVTFCHGIMSNTSDSCGDHGECVDLGRCECQKNYYGPDCNVTLCNNVFSNETNVCNGAAYGSCTFYEQCDCKKNYYGIDCNITTCDQAFSNETDTCTKFGTCWPFDICQCDDGYFGQSCNISTCSGVFSNTSEACMTHGVCWPEDICKCDQSGQYFGPDCNYTFCNQNPSNVSHCSDHGSCWPYEHCNCEDNYYGIDCNVTICNGYFSNETADVCTNHGTCSYYENCECFDGYFGPSCNITICYGVLSNNSLVCRGNGKCEDINSCQCNILPVQYFGLSCDVTTCGGVMSNQTQKVCENHGVCHIQNQSCTCDTGYIDESFCKNFTCFGVALNQEGLCSQHGECIGGDNCSCAQNYTSEDCSSYECLGMDFEDENVCSGHGDCVGHDKCDCWSNKYTGDDCGDYSCFGISLKDVNNVCAGHGACVEVDVCSCLPNYFSETTVGGNCTGWSCGVHDKSDPESCSGRGSCTYAQVCSCDEINVNYYNTPEQKKKGIYVVSSGGSYEGDLCETFSCGVEHTNTMTCNGNGKCIAPNVCECKSFFKDELCKTNTLYTDVIVPIIGSTGGFIMAVVLALLFLGVLLCCVCMCCVCVLCCGLGGLGLAFSFQKIRMKKFQKLEDVDLLLVMQQRNQDSSIAHLRINTELFEIPFDEIKTEKVLGEGGSNALVFEARWRGQRVAFKCFKTRDLCENQDDFDEFEREVEIISSLNHPNIIRFFGATMKPPRVGIIMEFCSNGEILDFHERYYEEKDEKYPINEIIRQAGEIVGALSYCHSRNIIHRDLKCENVLVNENESAKLMDFGLSKAVDSMGAAQNMTKSVGTNIYMAPEVVSSETYDEMCDAYSFAIMMFVLITGNPHPYGKNEYRVEFKVACNPNYRPNLSELDKKLKNEKSLKWVKYIVKRSWAHNPKYRITFTQINELFRDHLENVDHSLSGRATGKEEKEQKSGSDSSSSDDDGEEEEEGEKYDAEAERMLKKIDDFDRVFEENETLKRKVDDLVMKNLDLTEKLEKLMMGDK